MPQATFQQGLGGYVGTADTYLREVDPARSYATAASLSVDGDSSDRHTSRGVGADEQVLLRFNDIIGTGAGQIPEGAHITSATLTLHTTNPTQDGAELHRLLTSWSEEATWNALDGGVQIDGVEALSAADLVTGPIERGSSVLDVTASVQAWADGAANYGWAFLPSSDNGWNFLSSESAGAPLLAVTYTLDAITDPGSPTGPLSEEPPVVTPGSGSDGPFSGSVSAAVETHSVAGSGDVADDLAIWVNAANPSRSAVIGTDKDPSHGGLYVFDLHGNIIDTAAGGQALNNVDLRYGFNLGSSSIDLVGATNRETGKIDFFEIDPASRELSSVGSVSTGLSHIYGFSMAHASDGTYYAFVTTSGSHEDAAGRSTVRQFELDGSSGHVTGTAVRTFSLGSQAEGMVADDGTGALYIAEEDVGIWKYGIDPDSGTGRVQMDKVSGPHLAADVEGLTIYYGPDGSGYLIASSQGDSTYAVYNRQGDNGFLGSFKVVSGNGIDGASETDGIDVTNVALNSAFSEGLLVVHDHSNSGASSSNFKFIPWDDVAALGHLVVNTVVDSQDAWLL